MLIKNLDEVKINRTVLGVCCHECGGDLLPFIRTKKQSWFKRMFAIFSKKSIWHYKCSNCGKEASILYHSNTP